MKIMHYLVQQRDQIFVKDYEFLSFTKSMGRNIGKNKSKYLCSKYSHKLLGHIKQSATDAFKTTSKRVIQKTAEATVDLIWNKIANQITSLKNFTKE